MRVFLERRIYNAYLRCDEPGNPVCPMSRADPFYQQMQVRMPATIIAKSLNRCDRTELADFAVQRRAKVTQQAAVGALAQFGQQFAIVLEVDTQDLRQGKNVLTVRNGTEDGLA